MSRLAPPVLVPFEPEVYPEDTDLGHLATRYVAEQTVKRARQDPDWDRIKLGMAAARSRFPGPVGETLAEQLEIWARFVYRFGGKEKIEAVLIQLGVTGYVVHRAEIE